MSQEFDIRLSKTAPLETKLQEISGEGKPWILIFLFTEDPLLAMKTSPRIDWAFEQRFSSSNTSLHDLCTCKYTSNEHMIDIIGDKNGHNGRQRTRDTASYKASTYFKHCTHCYCAMKWLTVNCSAPIFFNIRPDAGETYETTVDLLT